MVLSIRDAIDKAFSRSVLGSIFLGVSAGKVIEKLLNLYFSSTWGLLIGWSVTFVVFFVVYVLWNRIEKTLTELVWD